MVRFAKIILLLAGVVVPASSARAECTCRANGTDYILGEVICLKGRLARCDTVLNNTSWTLLPSGCPQAGVIPREKRMLVTAREVTTASEPEAQEMCEPARWTGKAAASRTLVN